MVLQSSKATLDIQDMSRGVVVVEESVVVVPGDVAGRCHGARLTGARHFHFGSSSSSSGKSSRTRRRLLSAKQLPLDGAATAA